MGAEQTIAAFDCHPTGSFPDGTRGRQLSSKSGRSVRSSDNVVELARGDGAGELGDTSA